MADQEFLSMLTHCITIYRPSLGTSNSFGERTTLKGTIFVADLPARVQPQREKLTIELKGTTVSISHVCYTPIPDEGPVLEGDIVVFNSKDYKVVGVEDEAGDAHHYKLLLTKI